MYLVKGGNYLFLLNETDSALINELFYWQFFITH